MDKVALKWHYWEERRRLIKSWAEFRCLLLRQFLSTKEGNLHERFFTLKQESTVADYREKFEEFSAHLENLDNDTLEGKFVDGPKDDIKSKLRVNCLVGLILIMEMVQKLEDELLHFEEKYFGAAL